MFDFKLGIIGAGNMGGAIANRLLGAGEIVVGDIFISDSDEKKTAPFREKGVNIVSNTEAAKAADILIIAVKPDIFEFILPEIEPFINENKAVVSVAAGISIAYMERFLGGGSKIVRTMPNTPELVGCGMTSLCPNKNAEGTVFERVRGIFASVGKTVKIKEELMDAAVAAAGSSPAYVFMFIDGMARAAETMGLPREDALLMAAQSVYGAAVMVLETGEQPDKLKTNVCSPGGTTIEGVKSLEDDKFIDIIARAMEKVAEKSVRMTRV